MLLVGQDLEDCANTLIGDETAGMKGISGGQRRRVGVGLELVTNPRLIFLDEPTSGLDSEMATQVMDTLRRLSRRDRLVSLLHINFFCHRMPWTATRARGCCYYTYVRAQTLAKAASCSAGKGSLGRLKACGLSESQRLLLASQHCPLLCHSGGV